MKVRPMTAWLLGHVHRPVRHNAHCPLILNPGSPQAMDPGEAGGHAVWLMEISAGQNPQLRPFPLSSVQYDERDIDVSAVADASQLRGLLVGELSEYRDKLRANPELLVLIARLRLEGRTPLFSQVETICDELEENSDLSSETLLVSLDRIENLTQPDFDLAALACIQNPPGVVARLLLALESGHGGEEHNRLLAKVSECITGVYSSRPYEALDEAPDLGAGVAREIVLRQGYLLLAHLLDQRGAQP